MLVLNRRRGEAILLEGGIRIVILECDRRRVRVGIEAPPELRIQREELVSQIAAENRRAGVKAESVEWKEMLPLKDGKPNPVDKPAT